MTEETENSRITEKIDNSRIPVLPLRDVVIYPQMVIPLFVGRERSIKALDQAMSSGKKILLVAQKQPDIEDPDEDEIYRTGTLGNILQLLKMPDNTLKLLVEGIHCAEIMEVIDHGPHLSAEIRPIEEEAPLNDRQKKIICRSLLALFEQYAQQTKKTHHRQEKIQPEVLSLLSGIDDPTRLTHTIAAHLPLQITERQKLLEIHSCQERADHLIQLLEQEMEMLKIESGIRGRVKQQMEKSQREYYLNEKIKAIHKELGEIDGGQNELDELGTQIKESGMPQEARKKSDNELKKLRSMSSMSAEATVVRNYLDTMLAMPWTKRNRVRRDIAVAERILHEDHYGLDEVKGRILEYLAVQRRVRKIRGPILCLVGPPGVGKTSICHSLARATNRRFVKMALGGVRDEAEIRGHRRTYIGSMPGKIVQNISKVGRKNPLFLLDEIDKMSMDFRGDPSSALLEVLDPEQNHTFNDHYLEVDIDLSEVFFIATANSLNIPHALLDRMEVIRLPGYTEDEKVSIAFQYLLPKQLQNSGLKPHEIKLNEDIVRTIIRTYTREAGVRALERELAKLCRKLVKSILLNKQKGCFEPTESDLDDYLGMRRFRHGKAEDKDRIGQVNGLAWTEVGGELLALEAAVVAGKGKLRHTGQLGNVMQESIHAAMTVVRSRSRTLGIPADFYESSDIHIHVPEGATPKDGPSAGIGMCTALVSALTQIKVRSDVAMTGEITLRGEVLPIGGLKEKLLAAHRSGINTVIIPEENKKDLREVPDKIKKNLVIKPVRWIDQVFDIALCSRPIALEATREKITPDKKTNPRKAGVQPAH